MGCFQLWGGAKINIATSMENRATVSYGGGTRGDSREDLSD